MPYNQTISASGGTGNINPDGQQHPERDRRSWSLPASGSNAFNITGTPTAAGTETFTVTATDTLAATTSTNYSITVNPAVTLGPSTLPADTVNVAYNQTLTASGGTGSIAVTVSNIQNAIAGLILPASGSNALMHLRHAHGGRDRNLHGHGHRHAGGRDFHQLQHHGRYEPAGARRN